MIVEDMMNRAVQCSNPGDSLNRAAQLMWENTCGAVPIVDDQRRPVGFLTDRDVCMAAYTQGKPLEAMSVESAMARRVVTCQAADDLGVALRLMAENGLRRLPVVDSEGRIAGILALDDIACEAGRKLRGGVNSELRERLAEVWISICRGRARARV